jgi:hypothetical protein
VSATVQMATIFRGSSRRLRFSENTAVEKSENPLLPSTFLACKQQAFDMNLSYVVNHQPY